MNEQEKDKLFGEIGIDLGFFSLDDVKESLQQQKVDEAIGGRRPIGAYLLEKGKIDRDQVGKIVLMQERMVERSKTVSASNNEEKTRDATQDKKKKNTALVIVLNILWAGVGYFYLGKNEKGALVSIINLIFFWTVIGPVVLCIISCIDCYNIMQNENMI